MVSREEQVREELEILCTLQHSRIAALHEAYSLPYAAVLLQELLSGVDVLTYLGGRHQYTEHTVTTIVTQVNNKTNLNLYILNLILRSNK